MMGELPSLSLGWEVSSLQLWFRLWLIDSFEPHIRKRISTWTGVPQRYGVKLTRSLLPSLFILSRPPNVLFHHLLAPSSLAMIYPQLVQPSTPVSPLHFTLLTPHHNLLCHPDLPTLSHSRLTTTHGWSQRSQDVSCPFAKFAPAQVKASGLTVGGQPPLIQTSITPWKHVCKEKQLTVWSTIKHFNSWTQRSNRALYIGFVACQNIWVNFAIYSTMSKAMFVVRWWMWWGIFLAIELTSQNITS